MKRVAVVMSLVVTLLLFGVVVDYSQTDIPEIPGKITYIRDGNVWVAKANGDNPQRLTTTGDCSRPSWSPDGTTIAYLRHKNIWIINADGTDSRQLTTTADYQDYQGQLSWSPDGTKIAYFRSVKAPTSFGTGNVSYLWCYDLTTKSAARVIPDPHCWEVKWSPDGEWIAFLVDLSPFADGDGTVNRLEISSPSGKSRKTIIKEGWNLSFTWSSDSKRIYYSSLEDWSGDGDVFKVAFLEPDSPSRSQNIYKVQLTGGCISWLQVLQFVNEEELVLDENDYNEETETEFSRIVVLNVHNRKFKKETISDYCVSFLGDAKKYWIHVPNECLIGLVVNGQMVRTIEADEFEEVNWVSGSPSVLTTLVE